MSKIELAKFDTKPPHDADKDKHEKETKELIAELSELQNLLYAESRHSVLIVLQGMDAAGKDGAIRQVFSGVNPMGCNVQSFKRPTDEELAHDFLWRIHQHVPRKGMIEIFNRSHYEDVVVQKVHHWVPDTVIEKRYGHINAFENLLRDTGTVILKFFLHVSHKEQLDRLKERTSNPSKMWKYNPDDMEESAHWDAYHAAYEEAINRCSPEIPWTVVPTDKNWYKDFVIAKTLVEAMKALDMHYPHLDKK